MAGATTTRIVTKTTGLGSSHSYDNTSTDTVPVEHDPPRYIIIDSATTTAKQISDLCPQIALAKMYKVRIKAMVGTIYVSMDASGTGTITSATAQQVLLVGEEILVRPNTGGNLGILIDAAAVTDAIELEVWGKA